MANIKINVETTIFDGMPVTFRAPCDCTEIDGLVVYYPLATTGMSHKYFTFKDTHGNALTGVGNLFSAGAYVKVLLDTENGFAYPQNADTNGYLEGRLAKLESDYVEDNYVETGLNGRAWRVRKWSSGLAECWGVFIGPLAFSEDGNIYKSADITVPLPEDLFLAIESCSCTSNTNGFWAGFVSASGTAVTANFYTGKSAPVTGISAYYVVKGRWKESGTDTALLGEMIVGEAVIGTGG